MGDRIFISYRREDSSSNAGRLHQSLVAAFGQESVFMDVDDIPPGEDFRDAVRRAIADSAVLLAVIGRSFVPDDPDETSLLDRSSDLVRIEIEYAIDSGIPVIPVLVDGATMPNADRLPDSIEAMAYRNAASLNHATWGRDHDALVDSLRPLIAPKLESEDRAGSTGVAQPDVTDRMDTAALVGLVKSDLASEGRPLRAHDALLTELSVLRGSGSVEASDFSGDGAVHAERAAVLFADAERALALVATVAYWGEESTDRWWFGDIERLAHRPHASGSVALIDLARYPSVLLLYAAAVPAVAAERWALVYRLLTEPTAETSTGAERRPLAEVLNPATASIGSERLFRYLAPILIEHLALDISAITDAWERFELLHQLTRLRAFRYTGWASYVRISGLGPDHKRTVPEVWLSRNRDTAARVLGLNAAKDQNELDEIVEIYREEMARIADNADFQLLPRGGGALPSGRHYPGRFDDQPLRTPADR
jgi:hypothetical protein